MSRPSFVPYLWMLSACLSFAVMSVLTHALGGACDWQIIALCRSSSALILAALLAKAAGAQLVFWRPRTLWIRSLAGSTGVLTTFFALTTQLPVGEVLTLTNMFPIWVALLSWPLLRERPGFGVWIAVGSGIYGVVLIHHPHFTAGNFAFVPAVVSSFCTAIAMIGLNRLRHLDVRAIVVHFSGVSAFVCLASLGISTFIAGPPRLPGGSSVWMLLGVGLTATIGQLCLTKAFATGPAAQVAVVGLTQIAFAMALEILALGQAYDRDTLIGMGLVLAPCVGLMIARARVHHLSPQDPIDPSLPAAADIPVPHQSPLNKL